MLAHNGCIVGSAYERPLLTTYVGHPVFYGACFKWHVLTASCVMALFYRFAFHQVTSDFEMKEPQLVVI